MSLYLFGVLIEFVFVAMSCFMKYLAEQNWVSYSMRRLLSKECNDGEKPNRLADSHLRSTVGCPLFGEHDVCTGESQLGR